MRTRARVFVVVIALVAAATLLVFLLRPPAPRPGGSAASRVAGADAGAATAGGGVAPTPEPDDGEAAPPAGHSPDSPVSPKPADPTRGGVHGRLTFEDGTPVRGESVWLWGSDHVVAGTDDDGRYRIDGAWVGSHHRDLMLGPDDAAVSLGRVTLRAGGEVEFDAVVARGVELDLHVVSGENGGPLGGVWAILDPRPAAPGVSAAGRTDADGRIRWRHLPARGWTLRIDHEGRRSHREDLDLIAGAGPRSHTVSLEASLPLVLRVVPPPEKVGTSINLGFLPVPLGEEGPQYQLVGRLDAEGVFRGEAPPPGKYHVMLVIEGFGNRKLDPIEVVPRSEVEIVARLPAGDVVSGLLLGPDGKPVPGARIRLRPRPGGLQRPERRAAVAADGTFEATRVTPGRYEVLVEIGSLTLSGLVPDLDVVEGGLAGLRILLPRGGTVRARATGDGPAAGQPFHVDLERREGERWVWRAASRGKVGGDAVVTHLASGRWRVTARGAHLFDGWTEPVEVAIPNPESEVEVTLRFRSAVTISLDFRAASGAAVTRSLNLFVEPVEPKGPVWIAPVTPDDHGRGTIRLARPGRYRLIVLRKGGGRNHATVELDAPTDAVSSPVRVTLED